MKSQDFWSANHWDRSWTTFADTAILSPLKMYGLFANVGTCKSPTLLHTGGLDGLSRCSLAKSPSYKSHSRAPALLLDWSNAAGTFLDWMYKTNNVLSYLIEAYYLVREKLYDCVFSYTIHKEIHRYDSDRWALISHTHTLEISWRGHLVTFSFI